MLAPAHEALEHTAARLDAALADSPEDAELRVKRADIALRSGRPEAALAHLEAVHLPAADALAAAALLALGRPEEAVHRAEHALARGPNVRAYLARADAHEQLGAIDDALADLTVAMALAPRPELALKRARLLEDAGRPRAAAAWLALDADAPVIAAALVALQLRHGLDAVPAATALVDADPRVDHRLLLAEALAARGDDAAAAVIREDVRAALDDAISRRPTAILFLMRARALHGLGERAAARDDARTAASLAPSWAEPTRLLAELES